MFNGKKEDFEDNIKDCEKHIQMLHTKIENSLKVQDDCLNSIKQGTFKETYEKEYEDELVRYEDFKKALINAEDFLSKLKKSYESNFSKQD
ncbi:hypothetical protein [Lysinibacillus fusiformis]|uniref:hypothetical protein n=1 Tax=Lysinibacillus fusiformis TaxID=28031 RepID=UPI003D07641D